MTRWLIITRTERALEKKLNVNDDGIVDLFRVFVTVLDRFLVPSEKRNNDEEKKNPPANKAPRVFPKTRFSLKSVTLLLCCSRLYNIIRSRPATLRLYLSILYVVCLSLSVSPALSCSSVLCDVYDIITNVQHGNIQTHTLTHTQM